MGRAGSWSASGRGTWPAGRPRERGPRCVLIPPRPRSRPPDPRATSGVLRLLTARHHPPQGRAGFVVIDAQPADAADGDELGFAGAVRAGVLLGVGDDSLGDAGALGGSALGAVHRLAWQAAQRPS